jgi:hypothetical protein
MTIKDVAMSAAHTPGPWRWEINEKHKSLELISGARLTILEPQRWGMNRATVFLRDTTEGGYNLLHRVHERRDWIKPFPNREHHVKWCASVAHPDMQLIEAAPDLLEALKTAKWMLERDYIDNAKLAVIEKCDAAIAKTTGETP